MSTSRAALAPAPDDARLAHTAPRTRVRRAAAALAAIALGGGLALIGAAGPASAHHTTISGEGVCNEQTGLYDVTWTVENWRYDVPVTITESSRDVVPPGTKIATSERFTESGLDAGEVSLEVKGRWANGNASTNTGRVVLAGDCGGSPVEVPLELNYVGDCAPDATNTWKVRNLSDRSIEVVYSTGAGSPSGTHTAGPGDSYFETPRADETMKLSWGGGDSGVAAGSATAAAGADEECDEPVPPISTEPPVESTPEEPTLTGSLVTGECIADAPWISFDVALTDPDGQLGDEAVQLVLTDGTNTETIDLGTLQGRRPHRPHPLAGRHGRGRRRHAHGVARVDAGRRRLGRDRRQLRVDAHHHHGPHRREPRARRPARLSSGHARLRRRAGRRNRSRRRGRQRTREHGLQRRAARDRRRGRRGGRARRHGGLTRAPPLAGLIAPADEAGSGSPGPASRHSGSGLLGGVHPTDQLVGGVGATALLDLVHERASARDSPGVENADGGCLAHDGPVEEVDLGGLAATQALLRRAEVRHIAHAHPHRATAAPARSRAAAGRRGAVAGRRDPGASRSGRRGRRHAHGLAHRRGDDAAQAAVVDDVLHALGPRSRARR